MNVLVVGSGGREHVLAWKLSQSPRIKNLYIAPGNAGCAQYGTCVDLDVANLTHLVRWAREAKIDFVVPGPEAVLVDGIVNVFQEVGIKAFGPTKLAAELEKSKVFAKNLMRHHGIPTADYAVFEQYDAAARYVESRREGPLVVKADGLAAGKGAIVCASREEADAALRRCMVDREFGEAGGRVVVEEMLRGEEVSVLALTDGKTIAPLASAQDHKAIFDGDEGPNTGGMGAYSPAPILTDALMDRVVREILVPTVHAMNSANRRFRGVLYAGLMITGGGPKVLEYNVRFGDPEAQPVLMRLENDLLDVLEAVADGHLDRVELSWRPEPAVCVVMASGGYPGAYRKGVPITGLDKAAAHPDTMVFHAGTTKQAGQVVTDGGRVLGVTALGSDIPAAIQNAYTAVEDIQFADAYYRKDIGQKAIARLS